MTVDPFSEAMEAALSIGPSAAEVAERRRRRAARRARLRAVLAGPGFARVVDGGMWVLAAGTAVGLAADVLR